MTYQQTIQYLFTQLPMFQRIGKAAYKADLNNIVSLCNSLGNPQNNFKSIHVAGTNGKGSTSHLLASVLQENGYKTGLFTSPHLKDFRERIRINGKMISKKEVIYFTQKMKDDFRKIKPSFFEMTTALAFEYFAKKKVDVAVIEVGMGGRLDSTNIITPLVSVITNIGFDHTQFLGNTFEKIAMEKAGIIKENIPLVIGETQKKTKKVFINKAIEKNTSVFFADKSPSSTLLLDNGEWKNLIPLHGNYQSKNIKTVLQTIKVLQSIGYKIAEKNIRKGFVKVIDNTGLMGRWQILSKSPLTICDVAHNEAGIKEVIRQISETQHKKLHFILGMVSDKNHDKILALLPKDAIYYFCKPDIPRGLNVSELKAKAEKFSLSGEKYETVKSAFLSAKSNANEDDFIFAGGSTFVVAEIV